MIQPLDFLNSLAIISWVNISSECPHRPDQVIEVPAVEVPLRIAEVLVPRVVDAELRESTILSRSRSEYPVAFI